EAIAAAIAHAEPSDVGTLVDALLARGGIAALRVLIERFDALPAELQGRVQEHRAALLPAVGDILRYGQSQARVNALVIIRSALDVRHASMASDALMDRSAVVRKSAAETLRALTDLYFQRRAAVIAGLHDGTDPKDELRRTPALESLQQDRACLVRAL